MRKLTDFELATISGAVAVIGDLFWLGNDIVHAGRYDHLVTGIVLIISLLYSLLALRRHVKTGSKPVQSKDDIDYRIQLYMQREKFKTHCSREQALLKLITKVTK